jgi:hypothetical protein
MFADTLGVERLQLNANAQQSTVYPILTSLGSVSSLAHY